ncbi:Papain inhibitor [Cladophialophora carrionii]|uniref:Papain inhibitor n=1 Tax=Cladophialophora carrionii TaxID=86049 RepID=A0A1C1CDI9_9EURO|nr:Papain inhibitor [Cladophialophora carrionii]
MGEAEEAAFDAARTATIRRKPVPAPQPPPYPSQKRGLLDRWRNYSRRTKILVLVVVLAIIVLIIGLAAGLSTRKHTQNLPLPSGNGGPYTGDLTYYEPGLGACGVTSQNSDKIVAISHIVFDAVSVGSDPNANPLCGKKIRARRDNKSVDLTVVDRCTGCQPKDIDVTIDIFAGLADVDLGRVLVEWNWLENVPANAQG